MARNVDGASVAETALHGGELLGRDIHRNLDIAFQWGVDAIAVLMIDVTTRGC
jgi:hypothetical protein